MGFIDLITFFFGLGPETINPYDGMTKPTQGNSKMPQKIPVTPSIPDTGFMRITEILKVVPIGKSSWWAGVKSGRYPQGVKLGPKTTAWKADDIRELINKLGG